MIIRVIFGKEGALRFIGHLDVLRTFQKIFRRAGIPMAYSQGFSPHPLMSFALPLGLGLSSEGEYLDAEIEALIAERQEARKNKNYARADEIRDQLAAQGIILEDTREGVKWKRS